MTVIILMTLVSSRAVMYSNPIREYVNSPLIVALQKISPSDPLRSGEFAFQIVQNQQRSIVKFFSTSTDSSIKINLSRNTSYGTWQANKVMFRHTLENLSGKSINCTKVFALALSQRSNGLKVYSGGFLSGWINSRKNVVINYCSREFEYNLTVTYEIASSGKVLGVTASDVVRSRNIRK